MSQVELYQSILFKLGKLPARELAALDNYLSRLTMPKEAVLKPKGIAHLAGAWKSWDDSEFEDFLKITQQVRQDMFAPRQFNL